MPAVHTNRLQLPADMLKVCSVFVCPCKTIEVHAAGPRGTCLGSWQLYLHLQHSCSADASTVMRPLNHCTVPCRLLLLHGVHHSQH